MAWKDMANFIEKKFEEYKQEITQSKNMQDAQKEWNQNYISKEMQEKMKLEDFMKKGQSNDSDESGKNSSKDGKFTGGTNEEIVWNYFTSMGYTKECTAGIMGNMQQESAVSPKTVQNGGSGPGTGLIQWEDASSGGSGRWNILEGWASRNKLDKWKIETQLKFLTEVEFVDSSYKSELEYYLKKYNYSPGSDSIESFKKVNNVEHAVYIFELTWERAGDKQYENRIKFANDFYKKFKDYKPSSEGKKGGYGNPVSTDNYITSGYGMRLHPTRGVMHMHPAVDLAGGNLSIKSIADGKVTVAQWMDGGYGNIVKVDHGKMNGVNLVTLYCHFASISVTGGQKVTKGQQLGIMGTTGLSTGVHLHFEVHHNGTPVSPEKYFDYKRTDFALAEKRNGTDSVV